MRIKLLFVSTGLLLLLFTSQIANVGADPADLTGTPSPCTAPDNGTGTVTLPADCPYVTLNGDPMVIYEGLPPGTTIEFDATLMDYTCDHDAWCSMPLPPSECEMLGGSLGGHGHCFEATLDLVVSGTGTLTGFNRHLAVPVVVEVHTGPRNPGDPVQTFPTELYRLQGELFGDPDFCTFRIAGGIDFGLPSPGEMTLTLLPNGDYAVESFFDVTYQIEFEGCPGSPLDDYAGTTTATVRWQQGKAKTWEPGDNHKMHFPQLPDEDGWDVNATYPLILGEDWTCSETGWVKDLHFWGSWLNGQVGQINSFLVSIREDVPAGVDLPYSHPGEIVWEREITSYNIVQFEPGIWEGWFDPGIDVTLTDNHVEYYQYDIYLDPANWFEQTEGNIYWLCISADIAEIEGTRWGWKSSEDHWEDYATWTSFEDVCVIPDNGTGTITLPADCPYVTSEDDPMLIENGLPAGTTIEMDAILMNFICNHDAGWCSMPLAPGECETIGGSLGGLGHCFEATLDLTVRGTGSLNGFNRHLAVPVVLEIHTGSRNPGDPVQTFPADVYRLSGELFGDPDFCKFKITGGTDYGLPCPGQTTLTLRNDGKYNVDSFFDITYQFEFEGCPASVLEGYKGITTANVRWQQGMDASLFWQEIATVEADCIEPDDGTGTVTLPADCPYSSTPADPMVITGGLPPGTTIEMDAVLDDYFCVGGVWCSMPLPPNTCEMPGGSLGGHGHCFEATLYLDVEGTGDLSGFNRHLAVPVNLEVHTGPRNPGDPVQTFPTEIYRLQGELFGDPDFCEFILYGGADYGLPSPGQMTLTQLPNGDFAVESFFDVTYQIEFEGCPGSPLDDYMGATTATVRWEQGGPPTIDRLNLSFVITDGCNCGFWGDVNRDGAINPVDVVYMVNFVYLGNDMIVQPPSCPRDAGDVNCDGNRNPVDVVFYVNYVYLGNNMFCADPCN